MMVENGMFMYRMIGTSDGIKGALLQVNKWSIT